MNAIEILRAASRSVPNEDYVQFMAAVDVAEDMLAALELLSASANPELKGWGEAVVAIEKAKGEQQ